MSEPTVFIIDDDPSARRGLMRLVHAAGMNAESFASAEDFLASGECDGPGCIVLDVRMSDMTGPELQEELGKTEYCMPIIFLSAHAILNKYISLFFSSLIFSIQVLHTLIFLPLCVNK